MKQIAIIYHDADFDGILSNEVCRYWLARLYPDAVIHSYGWEYGRPVPPAFGGRCATTTDGAPIAYVNYDTIYIVDLSVDELMARQDLRDKIVWIDHHKTAIDKWVNQGDKKYGWQFTGYRIDGVAACRLCWQWLASENGPHGDPRVHAADVYLPTLEDFKKRAVSEPELIRLAGEYDIWDHRDPAGKALQFGLRSLSPVGFSSLVMDQFDGACTSSESVQIRAAERLRAAVADGYLIKNYMDKTQTEFAKRNAYTTKFEGLTFCTLNGGAGGSQSIQPAAGPKHDALLSWRYTGGKVAISLYHAEGKEHHDLSAIAKKFPGGGGHRGACGFSVDLGQFISLGLNTHLDP